MTYRELKPGLIERANDFAEQGEDMDFTFLNHGVETAPAGNGKQNRHADQAEEDE
jgi:hypothetical protein